MLYIEVWPSSSRVKERIGDISIESRDFIVVIEKEDTTTLAQSWVSLTNGEKVKWIFSCKKHSCNERDGKIIEFLLGKLLCDGEKHYYNFFTIRD